MIEILLHNRILFLSGSVSTESANAIITQLLILDAQNPEARIDLYINSPGGSVNDGLAIIDTMHCIQAPVCTICVGSAMSMAAIILAAGSKGLRYASPNAEIMLHLMQSRIQGDSLDIQNMARRISRQEERVMNMLAQWTGQNLEKLQCDINRDHFMTAQEARDYGLIDKVLEPRR